MVFLGKRGFALGTAFEVSGQRVDVTVYVADLFPIAADQLVMKSEEYTHGLFLLFTVVEKVSSRSCLCES